MLLCVVSPGTGSYEGFWALVPTWEAYARPHVLLFLGISLLFEFETSQGLQSQGACAAGTETQILKVA